MNGTGSDIEQQLRAAMEAHARWKLRLRTAMTTGRADITPEVAACDDRCDFGKWLHGPSIAPKVRASVPYQVVRRLHAEFHQSAGQALEAALGGQRRKGDKDAMADFDARSAKLAKALSKWMGEVRYS
jgi:hypothetical protein